MSLMSLLLLSAGPLFAPDVNDDKDILNARPHTCVTPRVTIETSTDGKQLRVFDNATEKLIEASSVTDVQQSPQTISLLLHAVPRQSCIAILTSGKEVWEISYAEGREPVYQAMVHDYQMQEGVKDRRQYAPRITLLEQRFSQFYFDREFRTFIVYDGQQRWQLINLDIRRKMFDISVGQGWKIDEMGAAFSLTTK